MKQLLVSTLILVLIGCGTEVGNGRSGTSPKPQAEENTRADDNKPAAQSASTFMETYPGDVLFAECASPFGQVYANEFTLREGLNGDTASLKFTPADGKYTVSKNSTVVRYVENKGSWTVSNMSSDKTSTSTAATCVATATSATGTLPESSEVATRVEAKVKLDAKEYQLVWYVTESSGVYSLRRVEITEGTTKTILIQR